MKYIPSLLLLLILIQACAVQEAVVEEIQKEEEVHPAAWFNADVRFSSDSLEIRGYSHSAASDLQRAMDFGREAAIAHLRFEVDAIAEAVRNELASEIGSNYSEPAFIIELRNMVSALDLSDAALEQVQVQREDGITEVFTKAVVRRNEILATLAASHPDSEFSDQLLK